MRIVIDSDAGTLITGDGRTLDLFGRDAFEMISHWWLKTSWNQKYSYTFTWMGRPIIQHPEDTLRLQEAIYSLKPDVIIETGVAHGGSLIFYASLFKAMGKGRKVIGVDIEIRPHNRRAIEEHELFEYLMLVEGNSAAAETVAQVAQAIQPKETVLVLLDSNHSHGHVTKELEAYSGFVTPGSYIVATDGIMQLVNDMPRGERRWATDNPAQAARDFVAHHPEFVIQEPTWRFNESLLTRSITAWPDAWLKRIG